MKLFPLLLILFLFHCAKEKIDIESWILSNESGAVLTLSKKELGQLPPTIQKLQNVEELTLQYNSLTSIPKEMGSLSKLRILNLYGNPLTSLPMELSQLKNLEVLLLGRTELETVPEFLPLLPKLKTLALDETKLRLTEKDVEIISKIPNLQTLDLTLLRKFETLPKNIGKLSHLKEIFMQKILLEKSDVARLRDELKGVRIKL